MIGLDKDLEDVGYWTKEAISAAVYFVQAARGGSGGFSDDDLAGAYELLDSSLEKALEAFTPRIAIELTRARQALGEALPPVEGCDESSATALALAISQKVQGFFRVPVPGSSPRTLITTTPRHIAGWKEFRAATPKLRGLTVPESLSSGCLIDHELDAAMLTRAVGDNKGRVHAGQDDHDSDVAALQAAFEPTAVRPLTDKARTQAAGMQRTGLDRLAREAAEQEAWKSYWQETRKFHWPEFWGRFQGKDPAAALREMTLDDLDQVMFFWEHLPALVTNPTGDEAGVKTALERFSWGRGAANLIALAADQRSLDGTAVIRGHTVYKQFLSEAQELRPIRADGPRSGWTARDFLSVFPEGQGPNEMERGHFKEALEVVTRLNAYIEREMGIRSREGPAVPPVAQAGQEGQGGMPSTGYGMGAVAQADPQTKEGRNMTHAEIVDLDVVSGETRSRLSRLLCEIHQQIEKSLRKCRENQSELPWCDLDDVEEASRILGQTGLTPTAKRLSAEAKRMMHDVVGFVLCDHSRGKGPRAKGALARKFGPFPKPETDPKVHAEWQSRRRQVLLGQAIGLGRLVRQLLDDLKVPRTATQARPRAAGGEAPGGNVSKTELRNWTQGNLDNAIRKYQSGRSARYAELLDAIRDGKRGAAKDARKLFGRNVIVRALGVRSPAMVSRSPAWHAIAQDLGIPLARNRVRGTRHTSKPGRIGCDMGVEAQSQNPGSEGDNRASDAALVQGEKDETLRAIRRLTESPKKGMKEQAKALLASYEKGEMTDEQVRGTVKTLLSPTE